MRTLTHLYLLFCLFFLGGCCTLPEPLNLTAPSDLPTHVYFRTRTETFNKNYVLALRDGRIWYKHNVENTQKSSDWKLLGRTGRPEGCGLSKFGVPQSLVSLSADGIHLQALGENQVIYRATNLREDIEKGVEWNDSWGWPMAGGPGLKSEWGSQMIWDVADAHTLDLKYYEDANETRHHIGLGVAHIYALDPEKKKIHYNDWWLPADWSRQVCGPQRGTFQAIQMSVSGSTLFVINQHGEMFTRLYDFDVSGENPFLTYTFVQTQPAPHVRRIPIPDWHRQPTISSGRITSRITIFQDGEGNAARTLRVEGEQDGVTGFFHKKIFAPTWSFQATHHTIQTPFLSATTQPAPQTTPTNPEELRYSGTLQRQDLGRTLQVELHSFHFVCSPSSLRILFEGKPILQKDGTPLFLAFHHVHTMVTQIRLRDYWQKGTKAPIRAGLIPPKDFSVIADDQARTMLREFFGDLSVVNLSGEASTQTLQMKELTRGELFRAPDEEKAHTARFVLDLSISK
jgi:hypothetical protein